MPIIYFKLIISVSLLFIVKVSFANRSCSKNDDTTCHEPEFNKYTKGLLKSSVTKNTFLLNLIL